MNFPFKVLLSSDEDLDLARNILYFLLQFSNTGEYYDEERNCIHQERLHTISAIAPRSK